MDHITKGSIEETRSQCYRLFDSDYISEKELSIFVKDCEQLSKRIANFISYLNKKDFKGNTFQ
jgi:four helix bundle protein